MTYNGKDVLADLRIPDDTGTLFVPDYNRAEADRRLREPDGNSDGHCRDCGLPVWWRDERLITRDGNRWCFGPGRSRVAMERWHALPGMAQYVVPAPEGKVCHCLDRAKPHIHLITETGGDDRCQSLSDLHWAPYQEFGIPDPALETTEAPAGPVVIGATGYRGNQIVVYWQRPEAVKHE